MNIEKYLKERISVVLINILIICGFELKFKTKQITMNFLEKHSLSYYIF